MFSRSDCAVSSVNISERAAEMFVEIGGYSEARERSTFGALGGKKKDFAIASLDIGCENRGDALAGHGLRKDQVAVVEI